MGKKTKKGSFEKFTRDKKTGVKVGPKRRFVDLTIDEQLDSLASAMETMTLHRIRHLPVTREEALVGIVSIGDVVNALRTEFEEENQHLKQYIAGAG